MLLITII